MTLKLMLVILIIIAIALYHISIKLNSKVLIGLFSAVTIAGAIILYVIAMQKSGMHIFPFAFFSLPLILTIRLIETNIRKQKEKEMRSKLTL